MPCCLSCRSRSELANPLDPQCSWMTISPGRGWKASWNDPPQVSLAKGWASDYVRSMGFLGSVGDVGQKPVRGAQIPLQMESTQCGVGVEADL